MNYHQFIIHSSVRELERRGVLNVKRRTKQKLVDNNFRKHNFKNGQGYFFTTDTHANINANMI